MISRETATAIALAYREVETAEKLLGDIRETLERHEEPDLRDAFGRRQNGLQLGVPSGQNSHRLFNVPWKLAAPVIEAHLAQQRAIIAALTEKAAIEIAAQGIAARSDETATQARPEGQEPGPDRDAPNPSTTSAEGNQTAPASAGARATGDE